MVKICIKKSKENTDIIGFTVKGHAGAGARGRDIVCSAVTAVAYMAIGALTNYGIDFSYSAESGDMECILGSNLSDEDKKTAQIILYSTHIGFAQIEESSKKYVSICEKEVQSRDSIKN